MIDWKNKLTSRKLWVAVSEFVGMLLVAFGMAEDQVTQIVALIMAGAGMIAYIVAEGLVDAKAASDTVILPGIAEVNHPDAEGTDLNGNG